MPRRLVRRQALEIELSIAASMPSSVTAGVIVNAKKVRRLMKEHNLNPRRRRRFVRTTDSDHDNPIFPFVAKGFEVHGPDQLWVAALTYITIVGGFAYAALILDAWSRRVVGLRRFIRQSCCASRCPGACFTWTASVFLPVRPGGLTLTAMNCVEWPVPHGVLSWPDPQSD